MVRACWADYVADIREEIWGRLALPRERAQVTLYIKPVPQAIAKRVLLFVKGTLREDQLHVDERDGSVNALTQIVLDKLEDASLFCQFQNYHSKSDQAGWKCARKLPGGEADANLA